MSVYIIDLHINSTSVSPISPQIQFIFIIAFLPPKFPSQNDHLQCLTVLMNDSQLLTFLNQFSWHGQVCETTQQISELPPYFLSSLVQSNVLHKQWRAAKATQCPHSAETAPVSCWAGEGGTKVWDESFCMTERMVLQIYHVFPASDARPYIKGAIHCRDRNTKTFPIWYSSSVMFRASCLGLDSVCKSLVRSGG